jgi:hypothetical protein
MRWSDDARARAGVLSQLLRESRIGAFSAIIVIAELGTGTAARADTISA